ncbi:MAG: tRNA (adenosine(37)-N6)-threonylcarbamoyltransferase complex ATPase subunit type 1 TsaE [Anaerovoracaceae bacterium]
MRELIIRNEEDTKKFGETLAETLVPGDVVALVGNLGTGKTTLTKYIAQGLGIDEMITSPTFTIVQEYKSGRLPMYHFDVYRIMDIEEMYEMGYEEYFFGDGVSIIEWADQIEEIIPEDAKIIFIEYGRNEGERIYKCTF